MSKNKDIAPCLSQMTMFLALMDQQCIYEALMWMKRHGKSVQGESLSVVYGPKLKQECRWTLMVVWIIWSYQFK